MEVSLAVLEQRAKELEQAEGMAWAELHAIQGRRFEVEHLLKLCKGEISGFRLDDGTPLEALLPEGDRVEAMESNGVEH